MSNTANLSKEVKDRMVKELGDLSKIAPELMAYLEVEPQLKKDTGKIWLAFSNFLAQELKATEERVREELLTQLMDKYFLPTAQWDWETLEDGKTKHIRFFMNDKYYFTSIDPEMWNSWDWDQRGAMYREASLRLIKEILTPKKSPQGEE